MTRSILARLTRPSRSDCWEWTGYVNPKGYGFARCAPRADPGPVHRFMYRVSRMLPTLPPNMDVHHVCGNRRCANPQHLELQPAPVNRHWYVMRRKRVPPSAHDGARVERAS